MAYGSWINDVTAPRVDVVILASASSAGIHGALVAEHLDEGTGAGVGFVAATVLLGAVVIALTRRPTSRLVLTGAAVVNAGLIGSYALAVTTGLPIVHPEVEPVDGLALLTKAVEAAGVVTASSLLWRRPAGALALQTKGT